MGPLTRRIDRRVERTPVRRWTAYQMREALYRYYRGKGSRKACLDAVDGISETTYCRIQREQPSLAHGIRRAARREAVRRWLRELFGL